MIGLRSCIIRERLVVGSSVIVRVFFEVKPELISGLVVMYECFVLVNVFEEVHIRFCWLWWLRKLD